PCVIRAHGSETDEKLMRGLKPNRLTKLLESMSYRRVEAASAISNYAKLAAERSFRPQKPLVTIHYGIPFIESVPVARESNTVAFAGTLGVKKGVIQLVEATALLYKKGIILKLHLYGKDTLYNGGKMSEHLLSIMPEGMAKNVTFFGHVTREQTFDAYKTCTFAVFPSHWESFGLTPIEAMMFRCPVIHTTIPTGFELIDNDENGILVDPYNVNELAEKMELLLNNPELRNKLGEKAILKVKTSFTIDTMCNKLIAFYSNTITIFKSGK
ncbi:MAG TPA: glycosyltransferase family 4 protein, partial [Chitinophagales bacterium]|nr:glycosyltransferase family 4 protein [Chitinophagales bacterium]